MSQQLNSTQWHPETLALHAGYDAHLNQRSAAIPIYQTSSFVFDNAEHGADLFNLQKEGFIYSRTGNPTLDILEQRLTALEKGVGAVTFASGMAAIDGAISAILESNDHMVTSQEVYGGTHHFFHQWLPQRGIHVSAFPIDRLDLLKAQLRPNTKIIFIESVSNPGGRVADIQGIAKIAHEHGIVLIVDNTVATPVLIQPIEHGADIVVHSLTKYIAGHGNVLGGVVIDSGRFPWKDHPDRYSKLSTPSQAYHGVIFNDFFDSLAYIMYLRTGPLRSMGGVLSPHSAFLILQGLETLGLRYAEISKNTLGIVKFLESHPAVASVKHVSQAHHADHLLSKKYFLKTNTPGIISFEIKGELAQARVFYDALTLFLRLVNIGDSKSLAAIPALTTHRQLSDAERKKSGISDTLVRLSVGIEYLDDLIADLDQALGQAIRSVGGHYGREQ